ncbi:hypothetical protein C2S53_004134 [Perilla frutescens var. hirtella]|uniref:Uncharacterized protein n=1 Tax=Perilla frutescens var. hirtella TaxID=608512 RepID=A0AAD4JIK9_PERFH|nr:hypothetical protein C2S53_004134 [Perilla frutescens var. hirtella]
MVQSTISTVAPTLAQSASTVALAAVRQSAQSLYDSVARQGRLDEAMSNNEDQDPELQFRGPITRSRAKKLQAYLQVMIRRKLEIEDDGIERSSSKLVNLLTIEDQEHIMEN